MAKGYVIAQADVTNMERWTAYVEKAKVASQKFGGAPIARGGRSQIMEGKGKPRNVILEFPSYENALGYVNSPEYAEAKTLREGAGSLDMVVVEGV